MWISIFRILLMAAICGLCFAAVEPGDNDSLHCCLMCSQKARHCAEECGIFHPHEDGCLDECRYQLTECATQDCGISEYLDPVKHHYDNDCVLTLE
ncbi:unnamed protein product [Dicrocoelium dendriticum]|nr:unnamed protein product [Dicrocoelium dendriticum]